MEHSFSVEIAQEYGMTAAVILNNLQYWIEKNKANDENFLDGHYWTYNSVAAFERLFPYLTGRQISTALKKLEDAGIVITGNYNKSSYDRTKWYAITEKGFSILQNRKMEMTPVSNRIDRDVEPIPDINTDITTNINTDKEEPPANPPRSSIPYQEVQGEYNRICTSFAKCSILSDKRKEAIRARINSGYAIADFRRLFEMAQGSRFLKGGNRRNWKANFDWLLCDANMAKVLDGNYNDEGGDPAEPNRRDGKTPSTSSGGDERNQIRYGYVAGTEVGGSMPGDEQPPGNGEGTRKL